MSLLDKIQAKAVAADPEPELPQGPEGGRGAAAAQPLAREGQAPSGGNTASGQARHVERPHPGKKDRFASIRDLQRGNGTERERAPRMSKHEELKSKLHKQILNEMKDGDVEAILPKIDAMAVDIIKEDESFRGTIDRAKVVAELIHDLTGFGPINPLLLDPDVSEVMVNGPDHVYVERSGKLERTGVQFRDDDHVMHVIEKIVSPIGRRVDESSPMVDARLPDGSRVNVIIPPLALCGPTLTIRKFAKDPYTIEDLIRFGTLSREMAIFLEACVKARLNIFVSGGTGSGKTTTLNVLSSFIPSDERIVTIEDAAELQLWQEHVVSLESRPPNIEGKGGITIRDLVRNSLRMRPERIVIGEVRGAEALDMLQAMNTGHDGSLATGHSNSPRDMIARLETMVLMGGIELPVKAIREQIAGAIDLIIQQTRLKDGTRRIINITEVQGMEGDVIVLQDIFLFRQLGVDEQGRVRGRLAPTGIRPRFYERLLTSGIQVPPTVFIEDEEHEERLRDEDLEDGDDDLLASVLNNGEITEGSEDNGSADKGREPRNESPGRSSSESERQLRERLQGLGIARGDKRGNDS